MARPSSHLRAWKELPGGPAFKDLAVPNQHLDFVSALGYLRMPAEWEGDNRLSPFPSWLSYIPYQELSLGCRRELALEGSGLLPVL